MLPEPGEGGVKVGLRQLFGELAERPVMSTFVIALVVRLLVAVASNLFHEGVLIPDEGQYLILALVASEGELTANFWPGYGQSLFHTTRTFMWPLTALFWLFGPSRLVAQLLPVLFGAVTAAATSALAGRVLRRPHALTAGLIAALFPSQILWSSVVLRESFIWVGLACIAVVVGYSQRQDSTDRILGSALAAGMLFVALVWLRQQTAALALWCLFPALLFGRGHRTVRALSAACVFVVAPWLLGMGPGAVTFAEKSVARLGSAHVYMSVSADSSFLMGPGSIVEDPGRTGADSSFSRGPGSVDSIVAFTASSAADCASHVEEISGTWRDIGSASGMLLERERGDWVCIHDGFGGAVLADNRIGTSLSRIPTGLYNTMLRPLPWEARWSNPDKFGASIESLLWIALYGLSTYGAWKHREYFGQLAFPILIIGAIAVSGAVTHGNLGTAFRHRGQMLFALAVLSSVGLQAIADRHNGRRDGQGGHRFHRQGSSNRGR